MARLQCLCDNTMSNATVPSDSIAIIHRIETIKEAIRIKMELIDLFNDEYEFWYCQKCKRITVINNYTGCYYRSYSRVLEEMHPSFEEVASYQEIIFYRDKEMDDATEEDSRITVEDFMTKYPSRYLVRLSPDETKAFVFSPKDKSYLFSYVLDPEPDFDKLDGKER